MTLLAFRNSVAAELAADLPELRWHSGFVIPGSETDTGCVYAVVEAEDENVHESNYEVHARIYKAQTQQFDEFVLDETDLIALGERIKAALRDKQTASGGVWYYRVTSVTIAAEQRWVEATVEGKEFNTFTVY